MKLPPYLQSQRLKGAANLVGLELASPGHSFASIFGTILGASWEDFGTIVDHCKQFLRACWLQGFISVLGSSVNPCIQVGGLRCGSRSTVDDRRRPSDLAYRHCRNSGSFFFCGSFLVSSCRPKASLMPDQVQFGRGSLVPWGHAGVLPSTVGFTGLAISELSKSVPQLLPYHETVPELTLKPPLNSQNSRPCFRLGLRV